MQFTFNAGITRTFQMTERLSADWRIDATNVLNRLTYTGVNATLGSNLFGLPANANTPRTLQTTIRMRF
jgi:outer membrane receptor protein involved in Fe transport